MAKEKEVKTKPETKVKANGSLDRPFPWKPPYPEAVYKDVKEGDVVKSVETVFVSCLLTQDVILNGIKMSAGPQTVGAGFAHQHSAVCAAPKE